MKKRIAVFANGWGDEYLCDVVSGVQSIANNRNADVFTFVDFSILKDDERDMGEFSIFKLPDIRDFDGVVLMPNSYNLQLEKDYLQSEVLKYKIPTVSVEYELDGIVSIQTDNYHGMHDLVEHMITAHNVRNVVYIGGPESHPESRIRLQAVIDTMQEYGMELTEENILYGDWAKNYAKVLMGQWHLEHNQELPDVVICANDIMAMAVCDWARENGFVVPDDFKVTGYDFTFRSQAYVPSIASVSHEWKTLGVKAAELLWYIMDGKDVGVIEDTKTQFVCAESCGCDMDNIPAAHKRVKKRRINRLEDSENDSHFRHMFGAANLCDNEDTLCAEFEDLFKREHVIEGENFLLVLEKAMFDFEENDTNFPREGFNDDMKVICYLNNGELMPRRKVTARECLYEISNANVTPGCYIYVPLSSQGKIYGYAMLNASIDVAFDNLLYSWTRHMIQDLEHFRRNVVITELTNKLRKISLTDPLTGIYNRGACEEIVYPMLQKAKLGNQKGVVMIADIDRMKTINDVYGHANGDLALKIVVDSLVEAVPKEFVVTRFGGDEFFIGGVLTDEIDMDKVVSSISEAVNRRAEKEHVEFDLSVSVGYCIDEPDEEFDVERCLRKADESMYDIKKIHHVRNPMHNRV